MFYGNIRIASAKFKRSIPSFYTFLELPVILFSEPICLKTCPKVEFSARSTRWSGQLQRALLPRQEGEWKQGLELQLPTATSTQINLSCFWNHTLKLAIPKRIFCATDKPCFYRGIPELYRGGVWKSMPCCAIPTDSKSENEVFFLNLIH